MMKAGLLECEDDELPEINSILQKHNTILDIGRVFSDKKRVHTRALMILRAKGI